MLDRFVKGDQFFVSSISRFHIEWGYSIAGRSSQKYNEFLRGLRIEILPLTKRDAEEASKMKPAEAHILDSLIASSVRGYDGMLWTADRDFLKFLPKSSVRIFQ